VDAWIVAFVLSNILTIVSQETFNAIKMRFPYLLESSKGKSTPAQLDFRILPSDFGETDFEGLRVEYMSYFQLQKYLKFLLQMKLIDKVTIGNPKITYRITKKGLRLLRNIDSIQQILQMSDES